jgi:hypothetical protein
MNDFKLIALYYYLCEAYDRELGWICQRFSNNSEPEFSDVECLTVYLFAIMEEEKFKIKSIHLYACRYLRSWFPQLPSYQAFNNRINRLSEAFPVLVSLLIRDADKRGISFDISLVDSMPIITCSGKRAGKVAPELTDKGYCSTKKMHYFGVKLHGIAFRRPGKLPFPEILTLTKASEHDLSAVKELFLQLKGRSIFADKAYINDSFNQQLQQDAHSAIFTPIKLKKGESQWERNFNKAANDLASRAVSAIRQPIESLFNWLIEKTDIQKAAKVRSARGLVAHVFGKIAAALALWTF